MQTICLSIELQSIGGISVFVSVFWCAKINQYGFTVGATMCNVTSGQRVVVVVRQQTNSDERHPGPCLAALFIVTLNF